MVTRKCLCGKEYVMTLGVTKCEDCLAKEKRERDEVRDFVEANPGVTIVEVSRVFGISTVRIREMIRNDTIQFSDRSMIKLACQKCGKPIIGGRLCEDCCRTMSPADQLRVRLSQTGVDAGYVVDEKVRDSKRGKMRYL